MNRTIAQYLRAIAARFPSAAPWLRAWADKLDPPDPKAGGGVPTEPR